MVSFETAIVFDNIHELEEAYVIMADYSYTDNTDVIAFENIEDDRNNFALIRITNDDSKLTLMMNLVMKVCTLILVSLTMQQNNYVAMTMYIPSNYLYSLSNLSTPPNETLKILCPHFQISTLVLKCVHTRSWKTVELQT